MHSYLFYGICWDEEGHIWPWHTDLGTLPPAERATAEESDKDWLVRALGSGARLLCVGKHGEALAPQGHVAVASEYRVLPPGESMSLGQQLPVRNTEYLNSVLSKFCAAVGYDFDDLQGNGQVGWFLVSFHPGSTSEAP